MLPAALAAPARSTSTSTRARIRPPGRSARPSTPLRTLPSTTGSRNKVQQIGWPVGRPVGAGVLIGAPALVALGMCGVHGTMVRMSHIRDVSGRIEWSPLGKPGWHLLPLLKARSALLILTAPREAPPHVQHREDEPFSVLEREFEFLVGEDTIP